MAVQNAVTQISTWRRANLTGQYLKTGHDSFLLILSNPLFITYPIIRHYIVCASDSIVK
jgi:hypothetical protein